MFTRRLLIGGRRASAPLMEHPNYQKFITIIFIVAIAAVFGFLIPSLFTLISSGAMIPVTVVYHSPTPEDTHTPIPTSTRWPTLTPLATKTPGSSPTHFATTFLTSTPAITDTPTPTLKPTRARRTPTRVVVPTEPEDTEPPPPPPAPTATISPPTKTLPPPATATQPVPVLIESCQADPSTVPVDTNVDITFIVQFSSGVMGYGFEAIVGGEYPDQIGCSGSDTDGDGVAFCVGSSGRLPDSVTANVTLITSVGSCTVSYSSR